MIGCTKIGCRDAARVGLEWTETPLAGWTIKNDRVFCPPHADEAIAELQQRGINVHYSGFRKPLI